MVTFTIDEAREFMVGYHMINVKEKLIGKEGIIEVFNKIKSIQYDPLNVVGRNSDLVLQARINKYKSSLLDDCLYTDRTLIDGWDKMMGIYQTKDYSKFTSIRKNRALGQLRVLANRRSLTAIDYTDQVIDHIKKNGPMFSRDIDLGVTEKNIWGHTKISSCTLDYLFHTGIVGISSKKNTQKKFDLMENLIGEHFKEDIVTDSEFIKWYIQRRISSMGIVSNKSGVMWSGYLIDKKTTRTKYLKELVKEGKVVELTIEGLPGEYFMGATDEVQQNTMKKVSFIAPLDNLIWDRDLIEAVFDFEYRWEVYTPIIKRKYGYYVLPILFGHNFVGRVEFCLQRKDNPLEVMNIWFEDGFKQTKKFQKELDRALSDFANYLGAKSVIYDTRR